MKTNARVTSLAVSLFAVGVLATACSSGDSDSASPAPASAPASSSAAESTGAVGTSTSPALGDILVNEAGRTLYAFDMDKTDPPMSNCYDDCEAKWPVVKYTDKVNGVDSGLIGKAERKDGTEQLTINNHPVYLFAGDSAAGDVKGQNVKNVWHVLTPQGEEVKTPASS